MPKSNSSSLSPAIVASALLPFGIVPSPGQIESIRLYVDLLLRWNDKIGLTTLSVPDEIVARHFGESLYCTRMLEIRTGRLADIGTGAGFPGLAIKLFCPDIELFLVEANKKKAAFLAEAVRILAVERVHVVADRFEDWRPPTPGFEFIASRALGHYPFLMRWAREVLTSSGKLVLWLGDEEGNRIQTRAGWQWSVPERIPLSRQRQILVGSPAPRAT